MRTKQTPKQLYHKNQSDKWGLKNNPEIYQLLLKRTINLQTKHTQKHIHTHTFLPQLSTVISIQL